MADSKLASPPSGAMSPPPNCAICLGTCTNKCYSDSCMHEFCFKCLLEWSKIKAECPLCKQAFKSIIHNIKSVNEYDEHFVENVTVEDNRYLENAVIYLPPATPPTLYHQYHFRTTFTVDSVGEHALQQMLLNHPLLTLGTFTPDRYTHHRRRRGDTSSSNFRRSVYNDNLWVYSPPDITGRYRDVSPSFFRNNPAARTRLVPWLNRELNALLYENTQQVMRLVDIIMDHLLRHHICSYMFRSLLSDYLGNKTDHFIHEFYNFMRSPFDMIGYDRHVIYTPRRPSSPIPYIDEIAVSDYDSDVILVSDTNNNQGGQQTDPVVINLVDTDSDEPIIVSEERNGPSSREEENRKPILPLKLRIKNRHKERSRGKKRHRHLTSTSSSWSTSDSDCDYNNKRYQQKKILKKIKKRGKRADSESSDNEDDLPLSSFANKRKKSKHSRHRSHTITSSSKDRKHRHHDSSSTSSHSEDSNSTKKSEPSSTSSDSVQTNQSRDINNYSNNSEDSVYSEHKQFVKSKIKDMRTEDKHNAGPSSGRLRNTLKKDAITNLWFSRPCPYESDSSDN